MRPALYIILCTVFNFHLQVSGLAIDPVIHPAHNNKINNNKLKAPPAPSSSLHPRDFHDTTHANNNNAFTIHNNNNNNEQWSVRFNVFGNVANPLQATVAATELTQFYSAILAVARVMWAQGRPQTWRRAAMGGLVLMFWSESPIPWEFLSAFLTTIIERTHGGFVGSYDLLCTDPLRGDNIRVSLIVPSQVIGHAAAAA
ncbi:hypothetical protein XANCAGTX0491_003645 [Xanthoria calcicola]